MRRVLVTGGAGYIGSHLVKFLLDKDYEVVVLDNGLFGYYSLDSFHQNENFTLVKGDIRIKEDILKSLDKVNTIVHLAGIVGEPACSFDKDIAHSVNVSSTKLLLECAVRKKVESFVFASSCSVYGYGKDPFTEESLLNPVDYYAETKISGEKIVESFQDEIDTTILRFATVYGLSRRMRFDLAVNVMSANAAVNGYLNINGGNQYRPFVHCMDVAKAIEKIVSFSSRNVKNQVFNIGSNKQNYKLSFLGEKIAKNIENTRIEYNGEKEDDRSYFVSFDKAENILKFIPEKSIYDAVREIDFLFKTHLVTDHKNENFNNLKMAQKVQTIEDKGVLVYE